MSLSAQCHQCGQVKRVAMVLTSAGVEYLCKPCRRELGYARLNTSSVPLTTDKRTR